MNIISINRERTKDRKSVSFNIEDAPSCGAVEIVNRNYRNVGRIDVADSVLTITNYEHYIDKEEIEKIAARIEDEEKQLSIKAAEEAKEREEMLNAISVATGVVLES